MKNCEWKSGLKVVHKGDVVHYCFYVHRHPSKEIEYLKRELVTDPEFDYGDIIDEVEIIPMTPQEFREFSLHLESISSTNH